MEVRDWPGYSAQKNHAADLASHDWILSIDADERVTPALAAEIRAAARDTPAARGYRIPRVTWYLGRWIREHRLVSRLPAAPLRPARGAVERRAACTNRSTLDGEPGRLRHDLQHYAYRDISHHLATIDRYTTLAAEQWRAEGRRTIALAARSSTRRWRSCATTCCGGGFTDGGAGLIVSALNSYYVFLKLAKLWERQHDRAGAVRSSCSRTRGSVPVRRLVGGARRADQ